MTTTTKPLFEAKYAENAETTQYAAPANTRTQINKFTGTNVTGTAATLTVRLVATGGTAGASNAIVFQRSLAAGETYQFPEVVNHVLAPGDFISTLCGTASAIVIRASGYEVV